jgi:hypothetical protein
MIREKYESNKPDPLYYKNESYFLLYLPTILTRIEYKEEPEVTYSHNPDKAESCKIFETYQEAELYAKTCGYTGAKIFEIKLENIRTYKLK